MSRKAVDGGLWSLVCLFWRVSVPGAQAPGVGSGTFQWPVPGHRPAG